MLRSLLLSLLVGVASAASAQDWQLVWADEFDYTGAPDGSKWTFQTGGNGWGNQELQHYTDRQDNARVNGDHLVIEARKEDYNGNGYTSARLNSAESWTYGRYEIRAQLPTGRGTWPAIWMLYSQPTYGNQGWPDNGEIDIMEHVGYDPNVVHATVHTKAFNHSIGTQVGESIRVPTAMSGFNVYAVEWMPNEIRAYVNDELYFTFANDDAYSWPEWPFDHDFHLLLNIAVGGTWGGAQGVDDSVFPQEMLIDYVRVYQEADPYPTVTLDSPTVGVTIEDGSTLSLAATAQDASGIDRVEFLQDGGLVGTATEAPYQLQVEGVASGCYRLSARATDVSGYVTETEPVAVVVGDGCPDGVAWPFLLRPASIPGIIEAEHYDLGGADVAYRDLSAANSGDGFRPDEGVDIRRSLDAGGGFDVTDVNVREWMSYTVEVAESGRYRILARVASENGGTIRLSLDGDDLLGDISLFPTGGNETYANAAVGTVDLPAGRHTLRLDVRGAGFSINNLRFTYVGASAGEDTGEMGLGLRVSPNPVNDAVEVTYEIPETGRVEIGVFDAVGRQVAIVASGAAVAGTHQERVDLSGLAPGVYTCVLWTGAGTRSRRLAVVR